MTTAQDSADMMNGENNKNDLTGRIHTPDSDSPVTSTANPNIRTDQLDRPNIRTHPPELPPIMLDRINYWKNDRNKQLRVMVTIGPFNKNYDIDVKSTPLWPPGWEDLIEKYVIAKEPYPGNQADHHYHICIVLKAPGISKNTMYPAWFKLFPRTNVDIQTKYKSNAYLMSYCIIPDKDKIIDNAPIIHGTTATEIKNDWEDIRQKRKRGTLDCLNEIEEAIKEGTTLKELRKLNNVTAQLFIRGQLSTVVKQIEEEFNPTDTTIPKLEDWTHDSYLDNYGKEFLRDYLKKQKEVYKHKHGQLYVYGEPDTCKTTTFMQIAAEEKWRVFEAPQSMREWGEFCQDRFDIIYWDEFNPKQIEFNQKRLNQLLEGANTTIDIKSRDPKTINLRQAKIPLVILSNYPPPNDKAFQARIKEVRKRQLSDTEKEEHRQKYFKTN